MTIMNSSKSKYSGNRCRQGRHILRGLLASLCLLLMAASCAAPRGGATGGEVTGVGGSTFAEPVPYGMVLVDRGAYAMGPVTEDTVRGIKANPRGVSIDSFWMDETEVTNSKYKQFVFWVRDSIIRERLADPAFGGNEAFKIEEDKEGNPVTPTSTGPNQSPGETPTRMNRGPSNPSTAPTQSPADANSTPLSSTTAMKSTTTQRQPSVKTGSTPPRANTTPTSPSTMSSPSSLKIQPTSPTKARSCARPCHAPSQETTIS